MEEQIIALSITDQLTGLFNRRGFLTLAEKQLKIAERAHTRILLLFADLDGLKWINDSLGHRKGDEALVETAKILREVFRESDVIARTGGDEFIVLAAGVSREDSDILKIRLQQRIDAHNAYQGREYHISMSIGIVYKDPEASGSIDELISQADALMYEQKKRKQADKS
jgi:diguanylate cyclase (GGDEF)-like protein